MGVEESASGTQIRGWDCSVACEWCSSSAAISGRKKVREKIMHPTKIRAELLISPTQLDKAVGNARLARRMHATVMVSMVLPSVLVF